MKKIILSVLFVSTLLVNNVEAKLNSFQDANQNNFNQFDNSSSNPGKREFQKMYESLSEEERVDYMQARAKELNVSKRSSINSIGSGPFSAIDPISKRLMAERKKQNERTIFDDIFDNALLDAEKKDTYKNSNFIPAITEEMLIRATQKGKIKRKEVPSANSVKVELPKTGEIISIPTAEHIPYFHSDINVRKDGKVEILETIVAVSTGNKIKNKFIRAFPEYSLDRNQNKHPYDIKILNTKFNDEIIDYKLIKKDNLQLLEMSNGDEIIPGVYKFEINYIVDRHIAFYDEFDEFSWNVTGNNWNMVISKASANLSLPNKTEAIGMQAASFRRNGVFEDVLIKKSANENYLFAINTPLISAEGFKIIASLEKDLITKPTTLEKINFMISDNISFIISLITLLFIILSMTKTQIVISKNNKEKGYYANPRIRKSISTCDARFILNKKIDNKSLISVIYNLIYNKNKISIEEDNNKIILIKKTDSIKNLNKIEKLVMKELFSNENTEFILAKNNSLKLTRLLKKLNHIVQRGFKLRIFTKMFGYTALALAMVIIAIFTNTLINNGLIEYAFVASISSAVLFISSYVLYNKFQFIKSKKIKNIVINIIAAALVIASIFGLLNTLNFAVCLNIILSVVTITYYTKLFSSDAYIGYLIIRDVKNYKLHIEKVLNGKVKEINNKKLFGYIYSFDLENNIEKEHRILEKKILEFM